ncbi:TetR/AcrR family transcriptional regulator [bacterium]|nr:TetR/AcrR family transcriptional regulator [bacterium]
MKRGRKPVGADRLLEAAARVFSRKGYFQASVDDVVAEAGVGKGTVYRHFADKPRLLVALLDRTARHLAGEISGRAGESGGLERQLTVVARVTLDFFARRPELLRIFVREGTLTIPAVRTAMRSIIKHRTADVAAILGGRNMLRPAAVFNGMVFGLLRQRLGISDEPIHPARDAAFLVGMFLYGFRGKRR